MLARLPVSLWLPARSENRLRLSSLRGLEAPWPHCPSARADRDSYRLTRSHLLYVVMETDAKPSLGYKLNAIQLVLMRLPNSA